MTVDAIHGNLVWGEFPLPTRGPQTVEERVKALIDIGAFPDICHNTVLGGGEYFPDYRIIYINGIMSVRPEAMETARKVSQVFGGSNVHVAYNSSHGFIYDIYEGLKGLLGFDYPPVHVLLENIRERLAELKDQADGKIVIIAHSEGGIILNLVKKYLTPSERQKLEVHTFGSGKLIDLQDFGFVQNVLDRSDLIAFFLNPWKSLQAWLGFDSTVTFVGTSFNLPWRGHAIENPKYLPVIQQIADRYIPRSIVT